MVFMLRFSSRTSDAIHLDLNEAVLSFVTQVFNCKSACAEVVLSFETRSDSRFDCAFVGCRASQSRAS